MALNLSIVLLTIILCIALIVCVAYILQRLFARRLFSRSLRQLSETPRYPKLNDELLRQIEMIEPSRDFGIDYKPCIVTLLDGRRIDCVYVVSEQQYFTHWGVWPEDDRRKLSLRIQDVAKIEESPSRLPPKIANELYQAAESGMGYCRFILVFSDNSVQEYITGNAIDFVPLPAGKSRSDIVNVLPHTGSGKNYSKGLPYYWCLYN